MAIFHLKSKSVLRHLDKRLTSDIWVCLESSFQALSKNLGHIKMFHISDCQRGLFEGLQIQKKKYFLPNFLKNLQLKNGYLVFPCFKGGSKATIKK